MGVSGVSAAAVGKAAATPLPATVTAAEEATVDRAAATPLPPLRYDDGT